MNMIKAVKGELVLFFSRWNHRVESVLTQRGPQAMEHLQEMLGLKQTSP